MTEIPDWLGPATDRLREVGLDEAADALARLERAVGLLEDRLRIGARPSPDSLSVALIAEHRGETPEETLARLRPPIRIERLKVEESLDRLEWVVELGTESN